MVNKMDYLIGKNPVLEALRAGRAINKILIAKGLNKGFQKEIQSIAKERQIFLQIVEKQQLDFIAKNENHQGVIAQVAAKEYVDWEDVLQEVQERKETPLFLILDGIEDPHNFGAILRTADATGVDCVIIQKHRAVPLTMGVAKASAGAIEYVPVARVTNLAQTMEKLKEAGFWIVGSDVKANVNHYEMKMDGPLVVVLGSEGKGMKKLVKDKCDYLVNIPMFGKVNSLNVSVAASVLLYEIVRQRKNNG